MPATRTFKCGVCDAAVGKSKGSILCSKCNSWIHLTCADVTEKHLAIFSERPESFSYTCAECINTNANNSDSLQDEVRALNNNFNEFVKTNQEDRDLFKASITQILTEFRNDITTCVNNMKADIVTCTKLINTIDNATSAKIATLELENDILHRRINRANIVLNGLPAALGDLTSAITSLCSFYGINVSNHDIYHICYINNKKLVLVKFNSVSLRDRIMKEYFKTRSLKLCDIIGGQIGSRVYLNDHFSPVASKLNALCRKLKKQKIILKYKILNADRVKASLTLSEGKNVTYDIMECAALLNDNLNPVS